MRKITFLGTGSADTIHYYNTCFFIHDENGKTGMLVDTGGGNGILTQLSKANIPLEKINKIFLTHYHIDHLLGVIWILRFLGAKISKQPDLRLEIFCPKQTKKILETFFPLLKEKVTGCFGRKIIFHEIQDGEVINLEDGKLVCFDIKSDKVEQFGFRYDFNNQKSLVMLGDEPYKEHLQKYCENVDLLIHDAYCLESHREKFHPEKMHHSTVREAAENAEALAVKKLVLTHTEEKETFGKRQALYQEEASRFFAGEVVVPDDLGMIEI